ncbi:MAG TPA: restriction endonuclease subunit S, partial [Candidatus Woesebacteria bacterium]|nr:restriction endonuclease subunit S [Candidatus Woesebacteria bacterium]
SIDDWIENLKKQKEAQEKYKKGMMQKIFSQEIRFKDGNGNDYPEWEEKMLGEIGTFFSGGTPLSTNKEYYNGTIPFIGSADIYKPSVVNHISEEAMTSSSAKLVHKGDLLYALYGANSGEVAISKISGAINQAVLCIRTSESVEYIYYLLLFYRVQIVSKYLQGGQGNLSANIIKKLRIMVPVKEEQQKVADFLSSIDDLINLTRQRITQA